MWPRIEIGCGFLLSAVAALGWFIHPIAYLSLVFGLLLIVHGVGVDRHRRVVKNNLSNSFGGKIPYEYLSNDGKQRRTLEARIALASMDRLHHHEDSNGIA